MRVSEIATVTASQVKLDLLHFTGQRLNYISLSAVDTKADCERTIPVSAELKTVLQRRLQGLGPDDHVFTLGGKRATYPAIRGRFLGVCVRAGVTHGDKAKNAKGERSGIVFHCFRHTRISRWVEAGYSDEIVRRASGHADLGAFRKYVHLDARSVMRLVENENATQPLQKPAKLAVL
jgi:integrase